MSVGHQLLKQLCIILELVTFTIGEFEYILGTVVLICVEVISIKNSISQSKRKPLKQVELVLKNFWQFTNAFY